MRLIFFAAVAALSLGCLKERPAVQAPVIIDIPPMPRQAAAQTPPRARAITVDVQSPPGWHVHAERDDKMVFGNVSLPEARIVLEVEKITGPFVLDEASASTKRKVEARGWTTERDTIDRANDVVTLGFIAGDATKLRAMVILFRLMPGSQIIISLTGQWPAEQPEYDIGENVMEWIRQSVRLSPEAAEYLEERPDH